MARSTAEIELVALVSDATKTVKKFASDTQKQLDGINFTSTVTAINQGFQLASAVVGKTIGAISGFATEFANAEDASANLAQSMRLVGDFTQKAVSDFNDFADAIAETTRLQDDQVIGALQLAKSFSLTNQEAKKVVSAAVDLSAATGKDLNSSVEVLAKTFNNVLGKELKQIIPELKTLTKEQLASGDAVDIVAARFRNSAEELNKTFGGQISRLAKSFGELSESLGSIIADVDKLVGRAAGGSSAVGGLAEVVFALAKALKGVKAENSIGAQLERDAKSAKESIQEVIDLQKQARSASAVAPKTISPEEIKANRLKVAAAEKAQEEINSIRSRLEVAGLTDIEKLNRQAEDDIKKIKEAARLGVLPKTINQEKAIAAIRLDQEKKTLEETKKLNEKARQDIQKLSSEPIAQAVRVLISDGAISKQGQVAIGAGIIGSITKGAAGAQKLVSETFGAAADAVLPGIGGAVSEIVTLLGKGPEETKKMVQEFAKALPEIINNIIKAWPVLIEALARDLPPALAKTFPFLAQRFFIEMVKNMPIIIKGFAEGLVEAAKEFVNTILDSVGSVGDIITGGGDSGGLLGGGGFLGLGLAEGGRVPNDARYSGDRFPARLDAGEQVFSRDLSSELENYLKANSAGGASNQPIQINLSIGLQQFAKIMLEADRNGYRVRNA